LKTAEEENRKDDAGRETKEGEQEALERKSTAGSLSLTFQDLWHRQKHPAQIT
jgi:hypothetical protein